MAVVYSTDTLYSFSLLCSVVWKKKKKKINFFSLIVNNTSLTFKYQEPITIYYTALSYK